MYPIASIWSYAPLHASPTGGFYRARPPQKLKLKLYGKKCILVIALNPNILYVCFLTAQLNRTLIRKKVHVGFNLTPSSICAKWPNGYRLAEILYLSWSTN